DATTPAATAPARNSRRDSSRLISVSRSAAALAGRAVRAAFLTLHLSGFFRLVRSSVPGFRPGLLFRVLFRACVPGSFRPSCPAAVTGPAAPARRGSDL